MYRASPASHGLWSVIKQELSKVPATVLYALHRQSEKTALTIAHGVQFLQGQDTKESAEMQSRRQQHKEMYASIMQAQARRAAEQRAQRLASQTWIGRLRYYLASAAKELKASVSTSAGVMALVQQCTAAHAAEVAMEQGIHVEDVTMSVETRSHATAVGETEEVVVGYIDAPSATEEEVYVFAERLQQACPMARQMHIEWRVRPRAGNRAERESGTHLAAVSRPLEMPEYGQQDGNTEARAGVYQPDMSHPVPPYRRYDENTVRRESTASAGTEELGRNDEKGNNAEVGGSVADRRNASASGTDVSVPPGSHCTKNERDRGPPGTTPKP